MEDAYAAADLALTRAGAGTVSELTAVGLPAVLVPLQIGNGEQALNGQEVVTAGGALMVPDAELDVDYLLEQVLPLINDTPRLERMSRASRGFGITDAADVMAPIRARGGRRAWPPPPPPRTTVTPRRPPPLPPDPSAPPPMAPAPTVPPPAWPRAPSCVPGT